MQHQHNPGDKVAVIDEIEWDETKDIYYKVFEAEVDEVILTKKGPQYRVKEIDYPVSEKDVFKTFEDAALVVIDRMKEKTS